MRVPPDQSGTDRDTAASASSGRRALQLSGDSRQLRRKQKRFDSLMPRRQRVSEMQQHARIALHRAADVAQQHQRTRAHAARPRRQRHHVAAAAETLGDRAPKVDARATAAHPSPRSAHAGIPHETSQRLARLGNFVSRRMPQNPCRQPAPIAPDLHGCFRRRRIAVCIAGRSLRRSSSAKMSRSRLRTCAASPDVVSLRSVGVGRARARKPRTPDRRCRSCSGRWTSSARQA